jgi:hypothetical protein
MLGIEQPREMTGTDLRAPIGAQTAAAGGAA